MQRNLIIQQLRAYQTLWKEESGLEQIKLLDEDIFDIDIHLIPKGRNESAHYHYDIRYSMQVTGSEEYIVSDESHDLDWIELEKIEKFNSEKSIIRMVSKWKGN